MERMKGQEEEDEQSNQNWSEAVEDLVTAGDTEGSITLLETEVSRLETLNPSETVNLQLASALTELAKLYSSKHFSLKSDQLLSRASLIKQRSSGDVESLEKEDEISNCNAVSNDGHLEKSSNPRDDVSPYKGSSDDDWEAIADHAPDELLSPQSLPSVSNICLEDAKVQTSKRRGRGPFTYQKHDLYSDRQSDVTLVNDLQDKDLGTSTQNTELTNSKHDKVTENMKNNDINNVIRRILMNMDVNQDLMICYLNAAKYGTHHVLVLADFPPSMRTTDLEKLFVDFKDRGFVIRWINDTAALAVFRTPSIALEACNHIQCSFTVRILGEDDELIGSIPTKDLEPPRQRPKTSARTAQRLIAHGMGLKLPIPFGSRELKSQEETRKNRIVTRQKMKDDAWGDD